MTEKHQNIFSAWDSERFKSVPEPRPGRVAGGISLHAEWDGIRASLPGWPLGSRNTLILHRSRWEVTRKYMPLAREREVQGPSTEKCRNWWRKNLEPKQERKINEDRRWEKGDCLPIQVGKSKAYGSSSHTLRLVWDWKPFQGQASALKI